MFWVVYDSEWTMNGFTFTYDIFIFSSMCIYDEVYNEKIFWQKKKDFYVVYLVWRINSEYEKSNIYQR